MAIQIVSDSAQPWRSYELLRSTAQAVRAFTDALRKWHPYYLGQTSESTIQDTLDKTSYFILFGYLFRLDLALFPDRESRDGRRRYDDKWIVNLGSAWPVEVFVAVKQIVMTEVAVLYRWKLRCAIVGHSSLDENLSDEEIAVWQEMDFPFSHQALMQSLMSKQTPTTVDEWFSEILTNYDAYDSYVVMRSEHMRETELMLGQAFWFLFTFLSDSEVIELERAATQIELALESEACCPGVDRKRESPSETNRPEAEESSAGDRLEIASAGAVASGREAPLSAGSVGSKAFPAGTTVRSPNEHDAGQSPNPDIPTSAGKTPGPTTTPPGTAKPQADPADEDALYKALLKAKKPKQSRLVQHMIGKELAAYHDLAHSVHGSTQTSDDAIGKMARETSDSAAALGYTLRYLTRSSTIVKEIAAE